MTAPVAVGRPECSEHWRWPIDLGRYDTTPALRTTEKDAIVELGIDNLRRLARHDPAARGWQQIRRLLRPLDDTGAALEALTSHRRRAMLDATAVVLLRCAETGRSYWSWTDEEWAGLLGHDQRGFRKSAPGWADDAVRPHLAANAFLLGSFTAFYRLGSFSRLTLARACSDAPAWTARSGGSAPCWPAGAIGSAAPTTSCSRWSPARCSSSTAALTWRS